MSIHSEHAKNIAPSIFCRQVSVAFRLKSNFERGSATCSHLKHFYLFLDVQLSDAVKLSTITSTFEMAAGPLETTLPQTNAIFGCTGHQNIISGARGTEKFPIFTPNSSEQALCTKIGLTLAKCAAHTATKFAQPTTLIEGERCLPSNVSLATSKDALSQRASRRSIGRHKDAPAAIAR